MKNDGLFIKNNGTREYYKNDKLHREDGPAVIYPNGTQEWWISDRLHRDNDLPAIVKKTRKEWYKDGERHRVGAPAIERAKKDGTIVSTEWWVNGLPHREDGPAKILPDGSEEYWVRGRLIRAVKVKKQGELLSWTEETLYR